MQPRIPLWGKFLLAYAISALAILGLLLTFARIARADADDQGDQPAQCVDHDDEDACLAACTFACTQVNPGPLLARVCGKPRLDRRAHKAVIRCRDVFVFS